MKSTIPRSSRNFNRFALRGRGAVGDALLESPATTGGLIRGSRFERQTDFPRFGITALVAAFVGIWAYSLDQSALPWVVGFGVIAYFIANSVGRITHSPYSLGFLATACYLAFACISLFYATCYFNNYGSYFGPASDDTYYFQNALDLIEGDSANYTLFEILLSGLNNVASSVGHAPSLMQLLPLNWMCGALIVSLSVHLGYEVTREKQNPLLLGFLLIGTSSFTDSVVHLYRDALLIVLIVGAMLCVARSRWGLALMVGFPALLLRPFNYAILLAYWFLRFTNARRFRRTANKLLFQSSLIAVVLVLTLAVDHVFKLGSYTRSIAGSTQESQSMIEAIESREALWDLNTSSDDMTAFLWKSGWGRLVLPAAVVLNPCKCPLEFTFQQQYGQRFEQGFAYGLWPRPVLDAVNVVLLPVSITLLSLGILRAWRAGASPELLFFVVTLLMLSYISFQTRHRMALYVMYPIFWSWGIAECRRRRHLAWQIATGVICVVVVRTFWL